MPQATGACVTRVGSGFYDLLDIEEGTWGLLFGNVPGVGPQAAALSELAGGARTMATGEHSAAKLPHADGAQPIELAVFGHEAGKARDDIALLVLANLGGQGGA